MDDSGIWNVDLMAARGLLAALNLEASDAALKTAAGHLSAHRRSSYKWAAERVHSKAVDNLETVSRQEFAHRDGPWTDGFRFAEQCVLELVPEELLEVRQERTQTKGQILRGLVRKAKRDRPSA